MFGSTESFSIIASLDDEAGNPHILHDNSAHQLFDSLVSTYT